MNDTRIMNEKKLGTLYLIPTPLAPDSLDKSQTAYAREVISGLEYFVVENKRTARRFISSLKTGKVIEQLQFEVLDKKTRHKEIQTLLQPLLQGKDMGLMSEAGSPGIADPGALLTDAAHREHIRVIPLVGPSSIFMALMASGFNGQSFTFHGYLPLEKPRRISAIRFMEKDAAKWNRTQIFMETPYRNNQLLDDLIRICIPYTRLCIACNITSGEEFIQSKSMAEWKKNKPDLHKKPTIFLLYG